MLPTQQTAMMRRSTVALILSFAVCSKGAVLRGHAESLSAQLQESGDWAALSEAAQAELEDKRFLLTQLDETDSQLKKLQELAELLVPVNKTATGAAIPAVKMPEVKKTTAPAAKMEGSTQMSMKKKESKTSAQQIRQGSDPSKMSASLGMPVLPKLSAVKGMKNQAALAPMLAMLHGLYDESKERISQQNVREEKSKKWFAEKEAEHKAKLAKIEGSFANHTNWQRDAEEFRTNETRDETRYFTYWQRCRERQHRQFHTNLKIQHAMMVKAKKMIDVYEKALSPKASDQLQAKKQLGQITGMPEVVLLQDFDDVKEQVVQFCSSTLSEVWKWRQQLHQDTDLQQQLAGEGLNEVAATLLARDGMTY